MSMSRTTLRLKVVEDEPAPPVFEAAPTVRIGTPADVDNMMTIALAACEENGFVSPNPVKLLENIWAALNLEEGIVGIIGDVGGPIEGAVLLRLGSPWYSDVRTIDERAIFIHPDYRQAKGARAKILCEFSKRVSDELGLTLTIGVLSNTRTAAKVRMYGRVLGEPAGAYWIYNGHTGLETT